MAQILLDRIEKVYPSGFHAVKGVSLSVGEGEFLVLLGPSGCGKSTTLRMIAGLEDLSGGTISIGGRIVNDVHPKDRDIAMVFQNYALYPHMTVRDNMAFALRMRRTPKAEIKNRVESAAEMLHITALLDRKPGVLSGGQRQRVAVGRAIVREPKAFLFDEPLSNLDAKLRASTRAEIKALHLRLHTTTVYVTHDQEEAMTLGDRVAIMAAGEVRQHGPPMELYRAPVDRFVAGFLGTPPMNFLSGRVETVGGRIEFVEGSNDPAGAPHRIALPASWADRLAPVMGKDAVLGVRPQAMDLVDAPPTSHTPSDRPMMRMTVTLVEPLGDQMDVTLSTPKHPAIIARVSSRDLAPGSVVSMSLDPARLHVFEPGEFGGRLTR
ncbi:MAG TPA: sn-glycerol-3-phosphate ABC transporter ATP-binding protein UgpC [Phycisphaerales bacterium]|nr:sn-glycerol-3-phosphate ABC transporter ATP-binding protein UgpC [Phycisphaerales bacterium]